MHHSEPGIGLQISRHGPEDSRLPVTDHQVFQRLTLQNQTMDSLHSRRWWLLRPVFHPLVTQAHHHHTHRGTRGLALDHQQHRLPSQAPGPFQRTPDQKQAAVTPLILLAHDPVQIILLCRGVSPATQQTVMWMDHLLPPVPTRASSLLRYLMAQRTVGALREDHLTIALLVAADLMFFIWQPVCSNSTSAQPSRKLDILI